MKKVFAAVFIILLIVASFIYLPALFGFGSRDISDLLSFDSRACSKPLTYSITNIDSRFGISDKEVKSALLDAESIWEKPSNKNLFELSSSGKLQVSFVYDSRQAATERLKKLGYAIDTSKSNYDTLKAAYNQRDLLYKSKLKTYQQDVADFEARQKAYQKEVEYWNSRGGAPKDEYNKLQNEQQRLQSQANALNSERDEVNSLVADVNALAGQLNRLASELNLNVKEYNTVGSQQGEEFQEGVYKSDASGSKIEIYQFDNKSQLIRVLAHELGHSLGLEHVEDKDAIMYRLNQSKNSVATNADLTELNKVCSAKMNILDLITNLR